MANTAKQTKRLRQRERAEARAAAQRRQEQRRRLAIVLGGLALVAVVVLAVVAFMGGGEEEGAGASTSTEVVAGGPPRTEPLGTGDAVPSFSAPGLSGGTVAWDDYAGAPAVLSVWAPWCPHCQEQKALFGASQDRLPYVECSPGGPRGAAASACIKAGVQTYPTWVFADGSRVSAVMSLQELADRVGYKYDAAEGNTKTRQ